MNKRIFIDKKYYLNIIAVVVNILLVMFIFSRSLQPDYISAEESEDALNFLQYIFPFELNDHIVRKMAHFCEFGLLGVVTTLTLFSFCRKPFRGSFAKLFLCLLTAVFDEALQFNSAGRSPQVSDVILDFSGSFTGIFFTTLIILFFYIKQQKKGMGK